MDRAERLKQALKENLKRRKSQARGRVSPRDAEPAPKEPRLESDMKPPHDGSE